jgi:RNA polymerase I-specific transcription initiation factor RRN3
MDEMDVVSTIILDRKSDLTDDDDNSDTYSESSFNNDQIQSDVKKMYMKLDCVMNLIFEYFKSLDHKIRRNQTESDLESVYYSLLDVFEKIILPTHRLKSTQFLVFYVSSLDNSFPEAFMTVLVTHILNEKPSTVTKVAAISVICFFIYSIWVVLWQELIILIKHLFVNVYKFSTNTSNLSTKRTKIQ